jgi:two-component system cell cycle sensor histidine kinase/response regulator CckA
MWQQGFPMAVAPTVLIAEDEEILLAFLSRLLRDEGYQVLTARDGNEALALASEAAGHLGLVLADIRMPHVDGLELAAHLRSLNPALPVVFMSGYPGTDPSELPGPFLTKPFMPDDLTTLVRQMLDSSGSASPQPA